MSCQQSKSSQKNRRKKRNLIIRIIFRVKFRCHKELMSKLKQPQVPSLLILKMKRSQTHSWSMMLKMPLHSVKNFHSTVNLLQRPVVNISRFILIVAIAELLSQKKMGYYRISDYPIRAVIKGLPFQCSTELIRENLQEMNFHILSVEHMASERYGRMLPFFKVQVRRNQTAKKIFQEARLCHVVVMLNPLKPAKRRFNVLTVTSGTTTPGGVTRQLSAGNAEAIIRVRHALSSTRKQVHKSPNVIIVGWNMSPRIGGVKPIRSHPSSTKRKASLMR